MSDPRESRTPVTATGDRSVAAGQMSGNTTTGDHSPIDARTVVLPPGEPRAPAEVRAPPGTSNLPRPPTAVFVGRQAASEQLAARLADTGSNAVVTQTVYGLGGVGKSELALHHAHAHRDRYRLVWWITADSPEQLQAGLAALAYRLSPPLAMHSTAQEAADWALGWLQVHTGWLLILDNVEDPAHVHPLLGQLATGHIVITTRRDVRWPHGTVPIRLGTLEENAAVELLTKITSETASDDRTAAALIAAELGYLPLALEQAAAYTAQTGIGLARYLTKLRRQPVRMFSAAAEGGDAQRTIARLWSLHLDALNARAPAAVELLRVLAWYAPDNIPRHLVADPDGQSAGDAAGREERDVDELLGLLASYSLITLTQNAVSIHRLTQAVLINSNPDPAGTCDDALARLARALPDDPRGDTVAWPTLRVLIPHVNAIVGRYPRGGEPEALADVLGDAAIFEWAQGLHRSAMARERRALAISEAVLGPDHAATGVRLHNLAYTLTTLGRYAEALPLMERALAVVEATLGADNGHFAVVLGHLAAVYQHMGRPADALPLEERAAAITEAALGPDHPYTGYRLDSLASIYRALGRPAEAMALKARALAITEAALGPDHPHTGTQLNNLAITYLDLGRCADALPLMERGLAITEAALGPDHPDTGQRLHNLAGVYRKLGRPAEALPLLERALAITEAALGPDHPDTGQRLDNLAGTHLELGRPTEALPLIERALAITETALGPDHPDTGQRLDNLAGTYRALGRAAEALPLMERAFAITDAALGPDHPTTRTTAARLAALKSETD